jgi:hypothetical protein
LSPFTYICPMAPVTSPPLFSFCAGKLLVWRRWKAHRMDGLYSFYPFLHLRLFLCMFFSLLSLSHVTDIMVLYIASSSFFRFFSVIPSFLMCPDVFACHSLQTKKHNLISYGQFAWYLIQDSLFFPHFFQCTSGEKEKVGTC